MTEKMIKTILKAITSSGRYDDGVLRIERDPVTRMIDVYLGGYFTTSCNTKTELADWLRDLPD